MRKFDAAAHIGTDPMQEIEAGIDDIFSKMEEHGVHCLALHPMGAGYIHMFKEQNRLFAELFKKHSQIMFFSTVNPWFAQDAERELLHSFDELGACGVSFNTALQGCYIDSPMIDPFIRIAESRNKPVYFFTGFPVFSLPLNLAYLANKFPQVKFIMGAMGVSDYWNDIIPAFRIADNLYLETSVNGNVPAVLPSFIEEFGDEKILFGTNYPYTDYALEVSKIIRTGIHPSSLEKIFYENSQKLLGGDV